MGFNSGFKGLIDGMRVKRWTFRSDLYTKSIKQNSILYFNTVLNTTIYNYLKGVYIKSWQHVSVVHSTIIRPYGNQSRYQNCVLYGIQYSVQNLLKWYINQNIRIKYILFINSRVRGIYVDWYSMSFRLCTITLELKRNPFFLINWDPELSGYAENSDNQIFL